MSYGAVHLLLDLLLVFLTASLLVPASTRHPVHAVLIRLLLVMASLIIGTECGLGLLGLLTPSWTTIAHLTALIGVGLGNRWFSRRTPWAGVGNLVGDLWRRGRSGLSRSLQVDGRSSPLLRALALTCLGLLLLYTGINLVATPLNFDSNTYRLPRIAFWLQEHAISHVQANDLRIDVVPYYAGLLMAWIMGHSASGYPAVGAPQLVGLVAMLLATWGWTGQMGLRPLARWTALLLLLATPIVALEALTSQTDLINGGLIIGSLYLLFRGVANPRGCTDLSIAALGLGLAVGAKGTVLYWAPAIGLMFVLLARAHAMKWGDIFRHCVRIAVLTAGVGMLPYLQNYRTFGHPLGPASAREAVHRANNDPALFGQILSDLEAYTWQLTAPNSNPVQIGSAIRPLFLDWYKKLHAKQPPPGGDVVLLDTAKMIYDRGQPQEDIASFGSLLPLLALAGFATGLRPGPQRRYVVAFGLGLTGFFLIFGALQTWTPFKFRYFTILAPVLAACAALSFQHGPRWLLEPAVALLAIMLGGLAVSTVLRSEEHGLLTLLQPQRAPVAPIWAEAGLLADDIGPQPTPVGISLPRDTWMASFFRRVPGLRLRFYNQSQLQAAGGPAQLIAAHHLSGLIMLTSDLPAAPPGLQLITRPLYSALVVVPAATPAAPPP